LHYLKAGLKQFGSNPESANTAHKKHSKAEPQVQGPDIFVVCRVKPASYAFCWTMIMVVIMVFLNYRIHISSPTGLPSLH
jgi:hypothetical protein